MNNSEPDADFMNLAASRYSDHTSMSANAIVANKKGHRITKSPRDSMNLPHLCNIFPATVTHNEGMNVQNVNLCPEEVIVLCKQCVCIMKTEHSCTGSTNLTV